MYDFKALLLEICIMSITVSIFKILLPNGNIRRIGEIVFTLLILVTALKPISNSIDFSSLTMNQTSKELATEQPQNRAFKEAVETVFKKALEKNRISFKNVIAEINENEKNEVVLQVVKVVVDTNLSEPELKEILSEATKVPPEIIVIQRN